MIKALFFDIDGTLVSFKTHQIPLSTLQALEEAKQRGIYIFISTGRPKVLITVLGEMEKRGLIDGFITMNGAYCFIGDKVVNKKAIDKAEVKNIMSYCEQRDIPCMVVGEHDICICQPDKLYESLFYGQLQVGIHIPERTTAAVLEETKDVLQLTAFLTVEQEAEIRPSANKVEYGRWHPAFADITPQGVTKHQGIDVFCKYFGIQLNETMAFGDGGNDIPMLCHAGIGVAMGNAIDEAKEAADYVTTDIDDGGVAHALRHFQVI